MPAVDAPFGSPTLLVDERARPALPNVQRALEDCELPFSTVSVGVARAARAAIANGNRYLVIVGDDHSIHEAVNALMDDDKPLAPDIVLGVVPIGEGNDFVKTFGLPEELERACAHLGGEHYYGLDVAKLTCETGNGDTVRYFANIAGAGLGATVVARSARLPLGRASHFAAFWWSLATARTGVVAIEADRKRYEGPAYDVVIGNCQFFGGGLRLSPRSYPGDGILDVLVMKGPKSDAFTTLPKMYRGEHVPSEHIVEMRGKLIRIDSERPLPLHADGEVAGTTPATIEAIPQAIRLKV